ncbi:MAG: hypothetical protein K0S20_571 [Patescibacteria group bacterium]|jgi:hypothetical protein|nr:hypothetical protein [Patescibacteria group bacterium]
MMAECGFDTSDVTKQVGKLTKAIRKTDWNPG